MATPTPDLPLPSLARLRDDARAVLIDFLDAVREEEGTAPGRARSTPTPPARPPLFFHRPSSLFPPPLQSPGKKTLVLEPHVAAWLGHIAGVALLREHGVEDLVALPLGPGAPPLDLGSPAPASSAPSSSSSSAQPPPVLFITRPSPAALAAVAAAVVSATTAAAGTPAAGQQPPPPRECRLACLPAATPATRRSLAAGGALGALSSIVDLPIGFLPVDTDTLSLEDPGAWRALAAEGDVSPAAALATALDALFGGLLGGAPATLRGVGPASDAVRAGLAAKRAAAGAGAPAPGGGWVDELILVDRLVDPLTPLLTCLTYEGLVGEALGPARGGAVSLPGGPPPPPGPTAEGGPAGRPPAPQAGGRVPFAAEGDPVFASLRDAPFPAVGPALAARARALQVGYREAGGGAAAGGGAPAASLTSLRALAAGLKSLPLVQRHVAIAEAAGAAAAGPAFRARMAAEGALMAGGGGGVAGVVGGSFGSGDAGAAERIEDALGLAGAGGGGGPAPAPPLAATTPAAGARLLALHALTAGGGAGPWGPPTGAGPAAKAASLRRAFLAAHGPTHLATLGSLEAGGLLRRPDGTLAHGCGGGGAGGPTRGGAGSGPRSAWAAARRPLRLAVAGGGLGGGDGGPPPPSPLAPSDVAYVCAGGIAPLSIRLVEAALAPGGWGGSPGAAEALRALPGPAFEVGWGVDGAGRPTEARLSGGGAPPPPGPPTPGRPTPTRKTVLVVFVGGATRAEVSALRWLGERGAGRGGPRFLVAASAVGGGEELVRGFCENE